MRLTRRQLLGGAADPPPRGRDLRACPTGSGLCRCAFRPGLPLLGGIRAVTWDNDVEVLVPPLHHQVVTATLRLTRPPLLLVMLGEFVEQALTGLAGRYDETAGGARSHGGLGAALLRSVCLSGSGREAPPGRSPGVSNETAGGARAQDSIRFSTDPDPTLSSRTNRACSKDSLDNIAGGIRHRSSTSSAVSSTSRAFHGFVGGGFDGWSRPSRSRSPSPQASLGLRLHSRQRSSSFGSRPRRRQGRPSKILEHRALGYADLGVRSTSRRAHLVSPTCSRISPRVPDLRLPGSRGHDLRAEAHVPRYTQKVPQGGGGRAVQRTSTDYARFRQIRHSGSIQPVSRLADDVAGSDGTVYPKGTAVPQRADFNTLDNPSFWTAHEGQASPTSRRWTPLCRLARQSTTSAVSSRWTTPCPRRSAGTRDLRSTGRGFNSILATTHRQTFRSAAGFTAPSALRAPRLERPSGLLAADSNLPPTTILRYAGKTRALPSLGLAGSSNRGGLSEDKILIAARSQRWQ